MAATQLVPLVGAPAEDPGVIANGAAEVSTRRDAMYVAVELNLGGFSLVCEGTVTQRTFAVVPPAVRAIGVNRTAVLTTQSDITDGGHSADRFWRERGVQGIVAELSVIVFTPAVELSGVVDGAAMVSGGKDASHGAHIDGVRGHETRLLVPVAVLSMVVVAPASDASVGSQCTGVLRATGEFDDGAHAAEKRGRGLSDNRIIPQLAVVIVAPAIDISRSAQRAHMVVALAEAIQRRCVGAGPAGHRIGVA